MVKKATCPNCQGQVYQFLENEEWRSYDRLGSTLHPHQCARKKASRRKADHPDIVEIEPSGCPKCGQEVWEVLWKSGQTLLYADPELQKRHRCDLHYSAVRAFNKGPY